jgi:hypothetical protein
MADHTITLQLDDVRDLFVAPEVDPFSPYEVAVIGEAGLVRMVRRYAAHWHEGSIHLTVQLPAEKISAQSGATIREALDRYCRLKAESNHEMLMLRRRIGIRSLLTGLLFLGVAMLCAALFASDLFSGIPAFLRAVLSEGFVVIGWVALWHPFEALVYDPIPLRRENVIYRQLPTIEITVEPLPARSVSPTTPAFL